MFFTQNLDLFIKYVLIAQPKKKKIKMTDFRKLVLLHTKTDTAKKLVPYLYTAFHSDQDVFRCLVGVPNEKDQQWLLKYIQKP